MFNVGQVSHQKSRTLSLSNGDANVTWIFGHSHHNLVSKNFDKATFLVRPTFGKGKESINSDRVNDCTWKADSLVFLPKGSEHKHSTEIESDWILLQISDSYLHNISAQLDDKCHTLVDRYHSTTSKKAAISACSLRPLLANCEVDKGIALESVLSELLHYSIEALMSSTKTISLVTMAPVALNRVIEFIDEAIAQKITLAQLANVAGFSVFHFAKAFKAATGHPPHQFVMYRRLIKAASMLKSPHFPVIQIALATGFSSQSHFASTFKNTMAMTPKEYRQAYLKEQNGITHFSLKI